jgi:hypothetical protein
MQSILPYLEQQGLANDFEAWLQPPSPPTFKTWWAPNRWTIIPTLYCPTDPTSPKNTTYWMDDTGR